MRKILNSIINFIYPRKCLFCKKNIKIDKELAICSTCLDNLPFIYEKGCKKCGKPKTTDASLCIDCTRNESCFNRCISIFEYKEPIREKIITFKQKGGKEYSKSFGILMANEYVKAGLKLPEIVIPVPIHIKKQREKGFNHSSLLSEYIADYFNIKLVDNVLIKYKDTIRQKRLNHKDRLDNVKDTFKIIECKEIVNKDILLVDDIYTTGATVNECSKLLKNMGANKVNVLVLASGIGY